MTAKTETKATVIKQDILDLEKLLAKEMTIGKDGVITVAEGTYIKLLPASVTEEQALELQAYNTRLAAAATLAVGNMAIPAIKKDKALDRVTMNMTTLGKDYLAVTFDRSRQVPSRDADNVPNGTKDKFGMTTVEYGMYGAKSRGELLKVKTMLSEMATAAFGK